MVQNADIVQGTVKIGRWEYPATKDSSGTVRNTKRDGSGEWVKADDIAFAPTMPPKPEPKPTKAQRATSAADKVAGARTSTPRVRKAAANPESLRVEAGHCGCGCGAAKSEKSKFLPGHDARLKGALVRMALANRNLGRDEYTVTVVTTDESGEKTLNVVKPLSYGHLVGGAKWDGILTAAMAKAEPTVS